MIQTLQTATAVLAVCNQQKSTPSTTDRLQANASLRKEFLSTTDWWAHNRHCVNGNIVLHCNEYDDNHVNITPSAVFAEESKESSLQQKGAQLYLIKDMEFYFNDDGSRTEEPIPVFQLRENDIILPMCHEGLNRSQLMYLSAMIAGQNKRMNVCNPHGAKGGFDPQKKFDNSTDPWSFIEFMHSVSNDTPKMAGQKKQEDDLHKRFKEILNVDKRNRVGLHEINALKHENEQEFNLAVVNSLEQPDVMEMRQNVVWRGKLYTWFTKYYYNPTEIRSAVGAASSRVVYLCFAKAFGIACSRLMDANPEAMLQDTHIVSIPWDDPIRKTKDEDDNLPNAISRYCRALQQIFRP